MLSTGIVAKKANNTTFALNTDGTVTIGGSLAAATGYFAGYLRAGAAIVENITMGSLDGGVTYGSIDVGAGGSIYGGKTAYSSTGAGFWLGYDGTDHKLNIGSSNNFVKWDGTSLSIQGTLQSSNFSTGTAGWKLDNAGNIEVNSGTFRGTLDVKSAVSGARLEVKNNVIKVFDSAGTLRVQIGDLTA